MTGHDTHRSCRRCGRTTGAAARLPVMRGQMKPQSILIVDDNQSNVRLMEAVLECGKYEIKSAADAEEALQLSRIGSPV